MRKPSRDAFRLSKEDLHQLYSARRFLGTDFRGKAGLSLPFDVYFQDPSVAARNPRLDFDDQCSVDWEPHLRDGPTSARFAVVDFNSDTNSLAPPAEWREDELKFVHQGQVLDRRAKDTLQYHQLMVWAILQRALRFFEEPNGLGRQLPWGFEGNRLIVVPHAGYGKNAYYDRQSKSLQFYYFDKDDGSGRVFTCLSTDIVHHEFGHAVLDGIRPLLSEGTSLETAAFHEAFGDLTAILVILRSNNFRDRSAFEIRPDSSTGDDVLGGVAEEFGNEVEGRPSLRDAKNQLTLAEVASTGSHHRKSQVLTGAVYDILLQLALHYRSRGRSVKEASWNLIQRMQRTVVQALDFLPPVDVTFRDYALAVVRSHELADPRDPHGYRSMIISAFAKRGILSGDEAAKLTSDAYGYLHNGLQLDVFHPVERIAASKADAYRFLDDNRKKLELPHDRDIVVADLYAAEKAARQGLRMPRQVILEYVWREDILLEETPLAEPRFGRFGGEWTSFLCGGTLVFDENSTVLWWVQKPNSEERRKLFLDDLARKIRRGQIGSLPGGEQGLVGAAMAPFVERRIDGVLRVDLAPHFGISENGEDEEGERPWAISS